MLSIYFWIATTILTVNAFLYTHSILRDKDESWKIELVFGVLFYIGFQCLLFKIATA